MNKHTPSIDVAKTADIGGLIEVGPETARVQIAAGLVAARDDAAALVEERRAALAGAEAAIVAARAALRQAQVELAAGAAAADVRGARAALSDAENKHDDVEVALSIAVEDAQAKADAVEAATRRAHEKEISAALDELINTLVPGGFKLVAEIRDLLAECFERQEKIKAHRRALKWVNDVHESFTPRLMLAGDLIAAVAAIGLPQTASDVYHLMGSKSDTEKLAHLRRHFGAAALRPGGLDLSDRAAPPPQPVRAPEKITIESPRPGTGEPAAAPAATGPRPGDFRVFG